MPVGSKVNVEYKSKYYSVEQWRDKERYEWSISALDMPRRYVACTGPLYRDAMCVTAIPRCYVRQAHESRGSFHSFHLPYSISRFLGEMHKLA